VTLIGEESNASTLAFQLNGKIVVTGTSYNGSIPFFYDPFIHFLLRYIIKQTFSQIKK
jgi:hypothetical protein